MSDSKEDDSLVCGFSLAVNVLKIRKLSISYRRVNNKYKLFAILNIDVFLLFIVRRRYGQLSRV